MYKFWNQYLILVFMENDFMISHFYVTIIKKIHIWQIITVSVSEETLCENKLIFQHLFLIGNYSH